MATGRAAPPPATWQRAGTIIVHEHTMVKAITNGHERFDALYADWRERHGAQSFRVVTTQMVPGGTEEGSWVFLLTYQEEGVGEGPR